jgi:hypothetical protein
MKRFRYFTDKQCSSKFTEDEAGNGIEIRFTFTNNIQMFSQYAEINFYIYNENGKVIGSTTKGTGIFLEPNESENYVVSAIYSDEKPAYFRIVYVYSENVTQLRSDTKYIVFE